LWWLRCEGPAWRRPGRSCGNCCVLIGVAVYFVLGIGCCCVWVAVGAYAALCCSVVVIATAVYFVLGIGCCCVWVAVGAYAALCCSVVVIATAYLPLSLFHLILCTDMSPTPSRIAGGHLCLSTTSLMMWFGVFCDHCNATFQWSPPLLYTVPRAIIGTNITTGIRTSLLRM